MVFYHHPTDLLNKINKNVPFAQTSLSKFYVLSDKNRLVARVHDPLNPKAIDPLAEIKAHVIHSVLEYLIETHPASKTKLGNQRLILTLASYGGKLFGESKLNASLLRWPEPINSETTFQPSLESYAALQYYGAEVIPQDKNTFNSTQEKTKGLVHVLETNHLLFAEALKRVEELPLDKRKTALRRIARASLLNIASSYPVRTIDMYNLIEDEVRMTYSWKEIMSGKVPRFVFEEAEQYVQKALGEQYNLNKVEKDYRDFGWSKDTYNLFREEIAGCKKSMGEIIDNVKKEKMVFIGTDAFY